MIKNEWYYRKVVEVSATSHIILYSLEWFWYEISIFEISKIGITDGWKVLIYDMFLINYLMLSIITYHIILICIILYIYIYIFWY